MAQSNSKTKLIASNKRASFNYHLEKSFEAGMMLKGSEVKSCRNAKVQLVDSYATFEGNEVFLVKAHIAEYAQGGPHFNHPPTRKRKLLLHKREILKLKSLIAEKGYSLIPKRMYFKNGMVKIELCLAKGKNQGDKRQSLKEKDEKRSIDRELRRKK